MELDHVKSMPLMAIDPKYFDMGELMRQNSLWNSEHKKHPWNDAPAKVKVTAKNQTYLSILVEYIFVCFIRNARI